MMGKYKSFSFVKVLVFMLWIFCIASFVVITNYLMNTEPDSSGIGYGLILVFDFILFLVCFGFIDIVKNVVFEVKLGHNKIVGKVLDFLQYSILVGIIIFLLLIVFPNPFELISFYKMWNL